MDAIERAIRDLMLDDGNGSWDECTTKEELEQGLLMAIYNAEDNEAIGFYQTVLDELSRG